MNIIEEITQNKFLLILLNEQQYMKKLYEIVKMVENSKNKICYVCLSKPYKNILTDLNENKINTKFFFFIDVLSSHYAKPEPKNNCIFLDSPTNLKSVKDAITMAIEKENCNVLLFDTISTLLIYQGTFPILRFTHSLMIENAKKIFIVLKKDAVPEEENKKLIKDLEMFADKTLDLD
jgi:predicted PP-loop superfamily ATPase